MGTPSFAATTLERLIGSNVSIKCVYSQPPKAKGRGQKIIKSPVQVLAEANGLEVLTPANLKEDFQRDFLLSLQPDFIIVAAYGLILPERILQIPKYGCINVHASLLPKWRGASPIQSAIINGDDISGITIMKMSSGLDEGDMLLQESVAIDQSMTAGTLEKRLADLGAELIQKFLLSPFEYLDSTKQQDETLVTYANKIKKEDGQISWGASAREILNKIRGLNPWPCAWTYADGQYLKILEGEVVDDMGVDDAQDCASEKKPADILDKSIAGRKFIVQCGKGKLILKKVCPSGGKVMSGEDFLNGRRQLTRLT